MTRRNIGGFNYEMSIQLVGSQEVLAIDEAVRFFEDQWTNQTQTYSVPYSVHKDERRWRVWLMKVMERTGMSSF